MREGDAAREVADGARRVAFVEALSRAEADELAAAEEALREFITDGGLLGDRVVSAGASADLTDAQLREPPITCSPRVPALVGLVADDRLRVPDRWDEVLADYADLQYQADRLTVAVFVEPIVADR